MASHLYRTRAMLQIPRALPAFIARTQATQTTPTAGKGIPTPGNFNSAIPPSGTSSNTTGNKSSPPFGNSAGNQSFMDAPAVKVGIAAALTIGIFAGYKMMSGNKDDSKNPKSGEQIKEGGNDKEANKGKGKDVKK